MKVAVEGCCHGELDKIYETIEFMEKKENVKVDLLLCCGDFQAVRNEADMKCMAVPPKYRQMQTFYKCHSPVGDKWRRTVLILTEVSAPTTHLQNAIHCPTAKPRTLHLRYYSGEKKAPVLTIFIGGNHEASNHLQELPYGGWVAPNIYYLGYAGVVNYRGVRIGGLSGIFKSHDYKKGHFECPPYSQQTLRSAYHVRNIDVFKLRQLKQPMDIFLSHDWPRSIYHYGNKQQLFKLKGFLRQEVETNTLGSPAASELLQHLKPSFWFAAHLHVKFAAFMQHQQANGIEQPPRATRFLALDKCLPHRDFLQVVDVEHDSSKPTDCLEYDMEWLAILKSTNHLINVTPRMWNMPENNGLHAKWDFSATDEGIKEVLADLGQDLTIPKNFSITVPCYDPNKPQNQREASHIINPQTTEFCAQFGLTDINARIGQIESQEHGEEEDADSTGSADDPSEYSTDTSGLSTSINPDEITLDDDDDDEAEEEVADGDISLQSLEPSPEHIPEFTVSFSDVRLLPGSMLVSSDEAMDSTTTDELDRSEESSPTEGEGKASEDPVLKRLSSENENGNTSIKKIKRRNQSIYASKDEDEDY